MSELNRVIEERLAAAEAGLAAAPVITFNDDPPGTYKAGDVWITTGGAVSIWNGGAWANVEFEVD